MFFVEVANHLSDALGLQVAHRFPGCDLVALPLDQEMVLRRKLIASEDLFNDVEPPEISRPFHGSFKFTKNTLKSNAAAF